MQVGRHNHFLADPRVAVKQYWVTLPDDPIIHKHRIGPLRKQIVDAVPDFMKKVAQVAGFDLAAVARDAIHFGEDGGIEDLVRAHREKLCMGWWV